MMRYIISIVLLAYLSFGFAAPKNSAHLDQSILKRYQNQTQATLLLQEKSIVQEVDALYAKMPKKSANNLVKRLDYFSQHYLHFPYILFALGEGHSSAYDQMPRVRTDGFDCQTYVDTMLALTFANNAQNFKQCLDRIRYRDGQVSFTTRHHFTSLDWNQVNQAQGYLKDITPSIYDQHKKSVALYAKTQIDKAGWYRKLPLSFIRVPALSPKEQAARLEDLRTRGQSFKPEYSTVPYLPIKRLITHEKKLDMWIAKQIPSGAIIEIIRPHWKLKSLIGTDLDVSHLGFAFWKNHTLYFRQASSVAHKVIDIPLEDYLKEASKNPTIGGINVQIIKIKQPLSKC